MYFLQVYGQLADGSIRIGNILCVVAVFVVKQLKEVLGFTPTYSFISHATYSHNRTRNIQYSPVCNSGLMGWRKSPPWLS